MNAFKQRLDQPTSLPAEMWPPQKYTRAPKLASLLSEQECPSQLTCGGEASRHPYRFTLLF